MLSVNVIFARLRWSICAFSLLAFLTAATSCSNRKTADGDVAEEQMAEDEEDEEWEEDTLVYDIPDLPVPESVDESFMDFLFTFIHQRSFQLQRVAYPIEVTDQDGTVRETLRNGRSITQALSRFDADNLVLLLTENQDPYDYMSQAPDHAEIQQVDLHKGVSRSFAFDRRGSEWMFTGIHYEPEVRNRNFMRYYRQFVTDSLFREQHLAPEIFVTLPSTDDDMEMLDGNIDSGQWDVFSPELPRETLLLLDLGRGAEDSQGVKFVKVGMSSSMMEVLTFGWEGDDWKLTRYEE